MNEYEKLEAELKEAKRKQAVITQTIMTAKAKVTALRRELSECLFNSYANEIEGEWEHALEIEKNLREAKMVSDNDRMLEQIAASKVADLESRISVMKKESTVVSKDDQWAKVLKEFEAKDINDRGTWLWFRNIGQSYGRLQEVNELLEARRDAENG